MRDRVAELASSMTWIHRKYERNITILMAVLPNMENTLSVTKAVGTALVTGASSGIGAVYAHRLALRGFDLILVARNRTRLDALAARVASESGQRVLVLVADLGTEEGMAKVGSLLRTDRTITALVNNAGVGATSPLVNSVTAEMDALIALNILSLTRLTQAAIPGFVERGEGLVINIASIAGIKPELLNGVYGATKAYVLAYSQALHHELKSKGITVQVVAPGAISTDFWDIAGLPITNLPEGIVMTAENLVDAALAGLDLGELVTVPSLPEAADWDAYEAARQALFPNLSHALPAARYRIG
jgi:short-subunit dehydrogenase